MRAIGAGPGALTVTWQASEWDGGAALQAYIIETRLVTSATYNKAATVDAKGLSGSPSYDLSGLVEGSEYYVRVLAVNEAGISKAAEIDAPVAARTPIREYTLCAMGLTVVSSNLSVLHHSCTFLYGKTPVIIQVM